MAISLIGGGAYSVKTIRSFILKKGVVEVSISDVLQLMLVFDSFIVLLIGLIVELIKLSEKNNRLSSDKLAIIYNLF